jgi:hypothetical protein
MARAQTVEDADEGLAAAVLAWTCTRHLGTRASRLAVETHERNPHYRAAERPATRRAVQQFIQQWETVRGRPPESDDVFDLRKCTFADPYERSAPAYEAEGSLAAGPASANVSNRREDACAMQAIRPG